MSVAVLIDRFVSASALIKFEAHEAVLAERKKKEVRGRSRKCNEWGLPNRTDKTRHFVTAVPVKEQAQ